MLAIAKVTYEFLVLSLQRRNVTLSPDDLVDPEDITDASDNKDEDVDDIMEDVSDDESEDDEPRETDGREKEPKEKTLTTLTTLTLDLADGVDVSQLDDLRTKFIERLVSLDLSKHSSFLDSAGKVKQYMAPKKTHFSRDEAYDIGDYVFVKMLGMPAFNRLKTIIAHNNTSSTGDPKVVARARNAANQKGTPKLCRDLLNALADIESYDSKQHKPTNAIMAHVALTQFRARYTKMVKLLKAGNVRLQRYFAKNGLRTSQGVTWAALTKRFLSMTIRTPTMHRVSNRLQQGQMVMSFLEPWGNGMHMTLPPDFISL
jgi:hypothetical protein